MANLKPCKHLDFDGDYTDCEIRDCAPHFPDVRYWLRGERWTDDGKNPSQGSVLQTAGSHQQHFRLLRARLYGLLRNTGRRAIMNPNTPIVVEQNTTSTSKYGWFKRSVWRQWWDRVSRRYPQKRTRSRCGIGG